MMSDRDFFWGFVGPLVAIGFVLCVTLVFGLPWLWGLLKPWLHAVTA